MASAYGDWFSKANGSYLLDVYDDNLEMWLDSLGINSYEFGPVFRKTKDLILILIFASFLSNYSEPAQKSGTSCRLRNPGSRLNPHETRQPAKR